MHRGQIFSLDLFVSLTIVIVVIAISTVLIDNAVSHYLSVVDHIKMQSIGMDLASYVYYKGGIPNHYIIQGFSIGTESPPSGQHDCAVVVRGTGNNQVKVYVCK